MVGAGIEYAVADNVTLKVEYNYLNFGSMNEALTYNSVDLVTRTITTDTNNTKLTMSLVKAGINILFH